MIHWDSVRMGSALDMCVSIPRMLLFIVEVAENDCVMVTEDKSPSIGPNFYHALAVTPVIL